MVAVRGAGVKLPTRTAQTYLAALGYDLEVDGKVGPVTREVTRAFQRYAGLTVDGIVGPLTSAALRDKLEAHAAGMMEVQDWIHAPDGYGDCLAYILQMWEDAGARETEGPNRGAWVRAICKRAGDPGEGRPWCGLTLMAADAMVRDWTGRTTPGELWSPSVDVIVRNAQAARRFVSGARDAQPGDAVVTRRVPGDWTHVAIVTERTPTGLRVISGNSGDRVREIGRPTDGLDTITLTEPE